LRTARYARSWKTGADVSATETVIDRGGERVPATLLVPWRSPTPLPGWIALGGISCMGRHHPQLVRFARALASTGAAVLVPEISEWRRLELAPAAVAPTIRGCLAYLKSRPDITRSPFGLIGFSFGAPQLAIAAARGDLGDDVAGLVLFGGYCSLERTMTCLLTGEHEWDGIDYRLRPDPFGGWVVASNHLTEVPGLEDAGDVASALHKLARAASGQRVPAWDPRHDPLIRELRRGLPHKHRQPFDLFATPTTEPFGEREERRHIAMLLARACRRADPLLDPTCALTHVGLPTRLIHGRGDRLIPFTEGLRLHESLPLLAREAMTVTAMFNHTADNVPGGIARRVYEELRMLSALHGVINSV